MPGADVQFAIPLVRVPTILPGQFGVPGTDNETGLRAHPTSHDPSREDEPDRPEGDVPPPRQVDRLVVFR